MLLYNKILIYKGGIMVPFTDKELMIPVRDLIEKIRPSLALDGGDIRFITVKNSKVYVQLRGSCVDCDSSPNTIQYAVARQLKLNIHPDIEVVNVPKGLEGEIENL